MNDNELKKEIFEVFKDEFVRRGFTDYMKIEICKAMPDDKVIGQKGAFIMKIGDFGKQVVFGVFKQVKKNAVQIIIAVFTILPNYKEYSEFYENLYTASVETIKKQVYDPISGWTLKAFNPEASKGYIVFWEEGDDITTDKSPRDIFMSAGTSMTSLTIIETGVLAHTRKIG